MPLYIDRIPNESNTTSPADFVSSIREDGGDGEGGIGGEGGGGGGGAGNIGGGGGADRSLSRADIAALNKFSRRNLVARAGKGKTWEYFPIGNDTWRIQTTDSQGIWGGNGLSISFVVDPDDPDRAIDVQIDRLLQADPTANVVKSTGNPGSAAEAWIRTSNEIREATSEAREALGAGYTIEDRLDHFALIDPDGKELFRNMDRTKVEQYLANIITTYASSLRRSANTTLAGVLLARGVPQAAIDFFIDQGAPFRESVQFNTRKDFKYRQLGTSWSATTPDGYAIFRESLEELRAYVIAYYPNSTFVPEDGGGLELNTERGGDTGGVPPPKINLFQWSVSGIRSRREAGVLIVQSGEGSALLEWSVTGATNIGIFNVGPRELESGQPSIGSYTQSLRNASGNFNAVIVATNQDGGRATASAKMNIGTTLP